MSPNTKYLFSGIFSPKNGDDDVRLINPNFSIYLNKHVFNKDEEGNSVFPYQGDDVIALIREGSDAKLYFYGGSLEKSKELFDGTETFFQSNSPSTFNNNIWEFNIYSENSKKMREIKQYARTDELFIITERLLPTLDYNEEEIELEDAVNEAIWELEREIERNELLTYNAIVENKFDGDFNVFEEKITIDLIHRNGLENVNSVLENAINEKISEREEYNKKILVKRNDETTGDDLIDSFHSEEYKNGGILELLVENNILYVNFFNRVGYNLIEGYLTNYLKEELASELGYSEVIYEEIKDGSFDYDGEPNKTFDTFYLYLSDNSYENIRNYPAHYQDHMALIKLNNLYRGKNIKIVNLNRGELDKQNVVKFGESLNVLNKKSLDDMTFVKSISDDGVEYFAPIVLEIVAGEVVGYKTGADSNDNSYITMLFKFNY